MNLRRTTNYATCLYFSEKISLLFLYFKDNDLITTKRSELYGTTDFLANVGGLLGLFMGVSTLSVAELIYFCTVGLISALRIGRKLKKEK